MAVGAIWNEIREEDEVTSFGEIVAEVTLVSRDLDVAEEGEKETGEESDEADAPEDADGSEESD